MAPIDDSGGDDPKTRFFVNDVAGAVLARVVDLPIGTPIGTPLTPDGLANLPNAPDARIRHMLVVDGQTLGISARDLNGDNPAIARFDFEAQAAGSLGDTTGHYIVTQPT